MEQQRQGIPLWLAIGMMAVIALPGSAFATAKAPSSPPARPIVKASALYLVELQSGRVLLEQNATRRLPPASLTKIMTALVALESTPPQEVVRIDERALLHRSSLNLRAGEEFLLRDLLTAMLVTSANDACQAVALHVGGDENRFVSMMNERALSLGLQNTHFANPCGFDAPGHYSTAAELARLSDHALHVPDISMMVRTVTREIATVDGKRQVALYSTNELLRDPDVNGVKTGYTTKAGRCLILSMFKDGHRLLLVGLNVMDRWDQAAKLLRYGQAVLQTGNG
ncbi:MAG: D-alanyl-D-alanine carboxypeptidase [Nitrospira sp.]|nr:D-alanyl-D-alanine carboxypeptidase [Nitrospira sp.]